MGKPTGFLDYAREENPAIEPLVRIENFNEFHPPLDREHRQKQGARCMNCGVPFCQSCVQLAGMYSGCPLHNLIPEWNDMIYRGNWEHALARLCKTASFPEFTGRVCPGLCMAACTCGANGDPVTVKENELALIEYGYENHLIKPRIPEIRTDKKIAVVGSGPSGMATADLLNRRGHNVTVYERFDRVGGLMMYGIPNMKLDKKIVERRVNLMKAEGVTFITNADVGRNVDAKQLLSEYDAVALCCGAKKPRPLSAQGSEAQGIMFAVDWLKSVTKSLLDSDFSDKNFFDPKGKHVVILGGGDTGNDCTGSSIRLGAASVTQLEMMPCPPAERQPNNPWPQWPKVLKTDYGAQESIEKFGHDPRVYKTTIKEVYQKDGKVCGIKTVQVEFKNVDGKRTLCEIEGSEKELPADLILIAAGFLGCEDYTANAFGVPLSPRNTIATSGADSYFTGTDKVFTAGDMHRGQSLVVWAIAEGRECAREIDEYLMGYSNL